MAARDFNTDGAAGAFESDGGAPSPGDSVPGVQMNDPGPATGQASTAAAAAAATPSSIEYSAPGAQGPVGTRTISDTGSGLSLNDTGSKPLPAWYYQPGGLQQNTGGMQRTMFAEGGLVGGDDQPDPGQGGGGVGSDKISEALSLVDHVMDYGRQQAGLSQGSQQPQSQSDVYAQMNPKDPSLVEDRRQDDHSLDNGQQEPSGEPYRDGWINHVKTAFNPMSAELGRDDIATTSERGPLPDPSGSDEQYDNTGQAPPQQQAQYGVPTDDVEGRY